MTKAADIKNELNKHLGADAVMLGSDPSLVVKYLSTGVLPIDVLLEGGIPIGRCTEVFGDYSTLKSYVALRSIATAQQNGHVCGLIDTEHSYDAVWLKQLGGNPDDLIVKQPDNGEQAVEVTEVLIRSGVPLIVWDSVAATITKASSEKKASDDVQPARLAAFMSRALPRLTAANKGTTALLWINQTRQNVGMTFGPTETTPGGKALPFYATYRLRFQKAGRTTEDTKVWNGEKMVTARQRTAIKMKATLEKSKLNRPDREVWFDFDLLNGRIDDDAFVIAQGIEHGLITMSSSKVPKFELPGRTKPYSGYKRFRTALTGEDIEWLKTQMQFPGTQSRGSRRPVRKKAARPK